jgi:UDP:flavonoid glycosyltransferase YjiC (YdhE family)
MMRVLFVSSPGVGHVFPMVPLAWALRTQGHQVLLATMGDVLEPAARAGLPVVDVRPGFDRGALLRRMFRETPQLVQERLRERLTDLRQAANRFARISELMVDGLLTAARAWRPDVIVQSQLLGAGLVAGGRLGVPVVDHGFGLARTGGMPDLHREHLASTFDRHEATLPERYAVIDVAPPSMVEPQGWLMRYVPYNGGATLPDWLWQAPTRPRVAVTLGTVAIQTLGIDPLREIVGHAAGVAAEFVLAVGDADIEPLGALPDNVRAAGWVPLDALLPTCAGVVHHGGAGTALTALACGVPQLILPSGADRHINADAVHRRGAGIDAETVTSELLDRLPHDTRLRDAAREVAAEIAGLPSPAEVAARLVSFAGHSGQRLAYPAP